MNRKVLLTRNDFNRFVAITTRWMDNDAYRHMNNVVYYSLFDTAVNQLLIEQNLLDIERGETIGLVVKSQCDYYASITFPDIVNVGVRVGKIGRTSVRYEIGIFRNDETTLSALGDFTHVYVNRRTNQPQPFGHELKKFLLSLEVLNRNSER